VAEKSRGVKAIGIREEEAAGGEKGKKTAGKRNKAA
jgi:hypothetical protein